MDDLISRQAAIEEIVQNVLHDKEGKCSVFGALFVLENLPTAEKHGKWIDYCGGVKCDQCGFECDDTYYLGEANFCPNCGARMEE